MRKIEDFKGEDPHLLIDLDALKRDDWPRYVTAAFGYMPAISDPEDAEVYTPLEATTTIRRSTYRLAAVPYAVAVALHHALGEERRQRAEVADLRRVISEAQVEDVNGKPVKLTLETVEAEAHEGGGSAAWLELPASHVVVPAALWKAHEAVEEQAYD